MTIQDINDIIKAVCPNDEDYEKPCISPKYLRQELEQLALEQEEKMVNKSEIPTGSTTDVPGNNVGKIEPTTKNDLAVASELEKNSKLEKIRDQLKSNLRGVEIALEVLVENDPLRPKMEGAKTTLEDCLELIEQAETED